MTLKDYFDAALPSDRLIIVKGKEEIFRDYVAFLRDEVNINIEETEIKRIGAYPYLTTKKDRKEIKKSDAPDYKCTDLDIKVFVRIEIK